MVPRSTFDDYDKLITSQADEAMSKIHEFARHIHWGDTEHERGLARELVSDYAYDCITLYGGNAAEIAAEFYDELAKLAGADVLDAIIAEYPTKEQVTGNVNYLTRSIWDKDEDGNLLPVESGIGGRVASSVGSHVNRLANWTIEQNAVRDNKRYARVPMGKTPCAFCVMLASRGFVYHSEKLALYKEFGGKYHDDCTCRAVCVFDDEGMEGYDDKLDEYWTKYKNASDALPDTQTRAEFDALSPSEKASYGRRTREGGDMYNNYRAHRIASEMRSLYDDVS